MEVIIDIFLILILALSTFLGYKKGLVKLGTRLFAGIIAIIITIVIYRPISGLIINNTQLDEKIRDTIIENTPMLIDKESEVGKIENEMLVSQTENISKTIVYAGTGIILFVVSKIILSIAISLIDGVAKLPILKQFNEVGGIIYGLLRGIIIVCIIVLIMGIVIKMNPGSPFEEKIQNTFITNMIYKNIVKF